jgi:hypothetical protein
MPCFLCPPVFIFGKFRAASFVFDFTILFAATASRGKIGQRALHDPAFLNQVQAGRHIKIRTFETFMAWLDANWPDWEAVSTAGPSSPR